MAQSDVEPDSDTATEVAPSASPSLNDDEASDANTEIHVKDADISSIIKIFSKKTKKNYILDERVKGKVSIFLPAKVADSEATRILDAILALKGFTTVPIGGNIFKVLPSKEAKKTTIPTQLENQEEDPTATVVTRLVRLNYVGAEDLQNLLSQLVSADGLITAYSRSNSLVIIDYADNIKRIVDIVDAIDVPSSDSDMTIVPIANADAVEIADTLKDILSDESDSSSDAASGSTRAVDIIRNRLREAAAARNEGQVGGDVSNVGLTVQDKAPKIIPDKRTNSIILVANEAETTRLRALITRLDSPVNLTSNRFYVYRCQHASAEELAEVLSGLAGGSSSGTSGSSSSSLFGGDSLGTSLGGSTSSRNNSRSRTQNRLQSQQRTLGQSRQGSTAGRTGTFNFGDDIAITADPATNSLIIAASKTDYERVLELLKQLDIKRRQVLVEATLLEVGLTDSTQLGAEYVTSTGGSDGGILASQNFSNLTQLFSNPAALSNFAIAAASSGTVKLPGGASIPSQAVLVTAAKNSSNVNVLSAPNILTTDNEEAEIVVGNNVPFISSTSTTQENLNNTFNQVDRQDVGITLRLTPQISSGEFVTLKIFTEVSSVVDSSANSPLGPTTTLRTSQTTVITKDGQMIAIGGLMSDDSNESESGIPFLKDIPLLGQLFRTNTQSKRQTNLLIFITPKIIKDQFDSRDETINYRDQIEQKIGDYEAYPDRREVLQSPRIDNVAEVDRVGGPKPGTIKAPTTSSQARLSAGEGKIVLRASPPVPKFSELSATEASPPGNSITQMSDPLATTRTTAARGDKSYILLRGVSKIEAGTKEVLPFPYDEGNVVGIVVPHGIKSLNTESFFSKGAHYGYVMADQTVQFEAIGIYTSPEEAHQNHSGSKLAWRTLSPYEIMHLGTAPWIKM